MSKTPDIVLLVPGQSGWEIWTGQSGQAAVSLHLASEVTRAGQLTELPAGEVTLMFPVRAVTAVPLRVTSDDDSLFPDLVSLHAERLGLRPDPMAGQLSDIFVIAREAENTALLSVFLRPPADGEMPPRGPKGFDLSARAWPVTGNTLAIWQEFGRWVFAVYQQGKLMYCQATAVDAARPDEALAREIRLSLIQLAHQGLDAALDRVQVWSNDPATDVTALRATFKAPVEVAPRPAPVPPSPLSKLLPADVRAARRVAQQRRNLVLGAAAIAAVYLGAIGWFGYGLWQGIHEAKRLEKLAVEAAPEGAAYTEHIGKWDELAHVIDLRNSPVDILSRIASCIPPASGLRLKIADISATEVKLTGEAPQLQAVNSFSKLLTKHSGLTQFTWDTPEPNQSNRGWAFVFSGEVPAASE